jgi:four helix bundle protein
MKDNVVLRKSFAFAVRIVKLTQFLQTTKNEFIISKQIMRSGTSVGALIRESQHAESSKDFVHKLNIALKEANETEYWLLLLNKGGYITNKDLDSILPNVVELKKLLISIIKTKKINS